MFCDFITKYTGIFCWKNERIFALQKLLTFFQQIYWHIRDINVWNFNKTLTNDVVSFEQLGPGIWKPYICFDWGHQIWNKFRNGHIVWINEVMMSSIELFTCRNNLHFATTPWKQFIYEQLPSIKKVLIQLELQWLEHWWFVYHGCFELILESLGKKPIAADLG